METNHTELDSVMISSGELLAVVRAILGGNSGREDDEHPLPPGPWGPVVRDALERVSIFGTHSRFSDVFGPRPEPWRVVLSSILARHPEIYDVIGGGHNFGDEVALNPQPLPPRAAFFAELAQTVVRRVELLQDLAGSIQREGEQQGIIIVGGYVSRFVDDFCGNGFRLKYPFPGPRPHWFASELNGIDLVVMAVQFDQAAKEAYSPELSSTLAEASAKLVKAGLSKMQ